MGFLEDADVARLTGLKKGRNGKTREQLQAEQLRAMGIAFRINARGVPIVTWDAVNGARPQQTSPMTTWTSAIFSG